jgi:hypothetical protein
MASNPHRSNALAAGWATAMAAPRSERPSRAAPTAVSTAPGRCRAVDRSVLRRLRDAGEVAAQPGLVGLRIPHVPRPGLGVVAIQRAPEDRLERCDELEEGYSGTEGQVDGLLVRQPAGEGVDEHGHDGAHIGEVPGLLTVAVDR